MSEHDNSPQPGWLDYANPDLRALLVTYRHVGDLLHANAPTEHWAALQSALVAEHTPDELANMLIGACALHARTLDEQPPAA